jgi:hypothetical protein
LKLLLFNLIKDLFLFNYLWGWGLGIGDWGLGIGPNPQSPIPNPQSPIPNPHMIMLLNLISSINY